VLIRARAAHYPHERSEIVGRYDLLRTNEKSLSLFLASRVMMTYFFTGRDRKGVECGRSVAARIDINSTGFPSNDIGKAPPFIHSIRLLYYPRFRFNERDSPPVDPFHLRDPCGNSARIDVIIVRDEVAAMLLLLRSSPSLYTVSEPRLETNETDVKVP